MSDFFYYDYYFVCGIIIPLEELKKIGRIIREKQGKSDPVPDETVELAAMNWLEAFGFVMKWVPDPKTEHRFSPNEELPMIVCRRWRMLTPKERRSLSDSMKIPELEERLPESPLEVPVFEALKRNSVEGCYFTRSVAVFP